MRLRKLKIHLFNATTQGWETPVTNLILTTMRKLKLLLALCMVTIAASASKTVYLAPGTWDVENTTEYFALWAWPEGGDGQWAVREEVGLGVYKFTFDDTCQKMFFLRNQELFHH